MEGTIEVESLAKEFEKSAKVTSKKVILCDAGYSLPLEGRPRKERILAISKQLVNFLNWQKSQSSTTSNMADITVFGCEEVCQNEIMARMKVLWKGDLPQNFSFSSEPIESFGTLVYLSPDADESLDLVSPPDQVVVGMLIDRRIKPNQSKNRAIKMSIPVARLPLERFNIDDAEPLNVDTVLVAMQQWWWNWDFCEKEEASASFFDAIEVAIQDHVRRHPNRPLHIPPPV